MLPQGSFVISRLSRQVNVAVDVTLQRAFFDFTCNSSSSFYTIWCGCSCCVACYYGTCSSGRLELTGEVLWAHCDLLCRAL